MKARKSPPRLRPTVTKAGGRNGQGGPAEAGLRSISAVPWTEADGIDERIFVQIASYRDPDCQWTLKDMFEKATNPDRVFAGVVWSAISAVFCPTALASS